METPNPIRASMEVCSIAPGRSVQRPQVLPRPAHLIRAGLVCLLLFGVTNVGFAQQQRVKLKTTPNQPNATVLVTDDRPRSTNGTDDSSVIKRIVMFPVRLGKRAFSALFLREGKKARSESFRTHGKSNGVPINIAQAELNKLPSESQSQFVERLNRLIKYEIEKNWDELYSLLYFRVKDVTAKEDYVQNRISQQRQSTYILLQFDPTDIHVFDKSIWGVDTWLVHGCGKFEKEGALVYLSTTSQAVLENGLWFFSGFQIVSDLDAPPKECAPNKTSKQLGRQEQRRPAVHVGAMAETARQPEIPLPGPNIEFEVDGQKINQPFKVLLYFDTKVIEPSIKGNSFNLPTELSHNETPVNVRFLSGGYDLFFESVYPAKFKTDWIVGVDYPPFDSENIDSETPEPSGKTLSMIWYIDFVTKDKGDGTRVVVKVYK